MKIYRLVILLRRFLQRLMGMATIGVKALIVDASGRVLLVEHTYTDGWHLPGGGVAPLESTTQAVIREVQEETGIVVKGQPQLFGVYAHKVFGASDYPVLYVIKQFSIQPKKPCAEIKQIAWFSRDNLPDGATQSTRKRLKEYFESLPPAEIW
ncbi:MAG: NUDIX domain-containing protein [Candidatus Berkiella sp.]